MGRHHFWFTVVPLTQNEPGTDLWAMEREYVSITPLRLDLTDHDSLGTLRDALPLVAAEAHQEPGPRIADVPEDDEPAAQAPSDANEARVG